MKKKTLFHYAIPDQAEPDLAKVVQLRWEFFWNHGARLHFDFFRSGKDDWVWVGGFE